MHGRAKKGELEVGDVIISEKLGPGKWVVTDARFDGGGDAHGPGDTYPDGWCLILKSLPNLETRKRMYQSGSFIPRVMLLPGEYERVNTATQNWEEN